MSKVNYREFVTEFGNTMVERTDFDGKVWFIPADESNSDYQRYLRWLEDPTAEESGTLS